MIPNILDFILENLVEIPHTGSNSVGSKGLKYSKVGSAYNNFTFGTERFPNKFPTIFQPVTVGGLCIHDAYWYV